MLKKVRHISIILGLLLCISLSFAWMTELDSQGGRYVHLEYDGKLYTAANEMEAWLSMVETQIVGGVEQEVLIDATKYYDPQNDAVFSTENFAPGDYKVFELKLKNKTTSPMSVSINFAKIQGDDLFLDYLNAGISGSKGFTDECPPPKIEEVAMKERATGNGAVKLVEMLWLPPAATGAGAVVDNTVSIRFYIRFSHTAGNELQDKTFKIGVINILAS